MSLSLDFGDDFKKAFTCHRREFLAVDLLSKDQETSPVPQQVGLLGCYKARKATVLKPKVYTPKAISIEKCIDWLQLDTNNFG